MERHPVRGLMSVTAANFWDWSPRVPALPHVVGLGQLEASLTGHGAPVRVIGTKVTEQFFAVMGVPPAIGRAFDASDFQGQGRTVIITDGLWERQFGRAAGVLGALVLIDGEAHTVIGVMPRTFKTIGNSEVWVPWIMTAQERTERRFHMVGVMARVGPGRTAADAERELQGLYRQLAAEHPETTAEWTARVVPLRELLLGDSRTALRVLGAAVLALLVVATINVIGLMLAWLRTRRQELVVRIALGASSGRIVRQLLVEALVWASAGIVGGVWLSAAFVRLFGAVGVSPALEYDFEPRIDGGVVLAMAALLGLLVIVTTAVPAWIGARGAVDLVARRAAPTGRWGQRFAIAVQVALSVVLICASAALLAGFRRVAEIAGPAQDTTLAVDISLAEGRYRDEARQAAFFDDLLRALATRPEIRRAGAASYVPPARIFGNYRFAIEGREVPTDSQTTLASAVDPDALEILGVGVQRGRAIERRDDAAAPRVGAISAALARRYWPDEDPIGHRVTLFGDATPITIVGVVDDARQPLSTESRAESVLYLSYRQVPWPFMTMLIDPAGPPAAAMAALRDEVVRLDAAQAIGQARPLDEIRREWMTQPRLRSRIVAVFGGATLLLTLVGLWARVAYGVAARTRELAIRQALGARPADVIQIASREAVLVVLAGAAAGLALLPASAAGMQALIPGLPSAGWPVVLAAMAAFVVLALASAYGPARRAGRIAPAAVLRAE